MDATAAVVGGLIGGAAMVGMLYPAMWMMPRQMKMDFLLIVGTMAVPAGPGAYGVGLVVHAIMSAVFGLVHGGLLEAAGVTSAGTGAGLGALFGLGHAAIAGMALGMMPMLHPRMLPEQPKLLPAFAGLAPGPEERLLEPPGYFGLNYPLPTTMGFFALHILFGVIVGLVYGGLA